MNHKDIYTAVIAFGSNLEAPARQVRQAAATVAALPNMVSFHLSSLYRTAPVGYTEQPDFINAVALVQTRDSAMALLQRLQAVEQAFGRERTFRNAPRTLDLDLIDFHHEIWQTDTLTLPHPRAHERGFVMCPLAEIAPDYVLGSHGRAADLARALADDGIVRLQEETA